MISEISNGISGRMYEIWQQLVTPCCSEIDPLGPLLFSLVLLDFMNSIDVPTDISLKLWYLDDGTFAGTRPAVAELLELFRNHGPSFGLTLNLKKCEIFWPSGDTVFQDFPPEICRPLQISNGVDLLGAPIFGSPEIVNVLSQYSIRDRSLHTYFITSHFLMSNYATVYPGLLGLLYLTLHGNKPPFPCGWVAWVFGKPPTCLQPSLAAVLLAKNWFGLDLFCYGLYPPLSLVWHFHLLNLLWLSASGWEYLYFQKLILFYVAAINLLTVLVTTSLAAAMVLYASGRHNALCDIIYYALLEDSADVRREQGVSGESASRPGDVFHPDFHNGHPTYFDISVRSAVHSGVITRSASSPGFAVLKGEMEKDARHRDLVEAAGGVCFPTCSGQLWGLDPLKY